ncbi:hypothetical protein IFM89_031703 [Coptis chinensis]|uniref:Prephenate/arogenate dehydrogenase domain-containing protein n=1 Tax=Coptis chinensis TaxID=261450 RepID=A0A835LP34_9MAGN|nr:hypothetical protein IFM89_031703 [Coptis chinensis]
MASFHLCNSIANVNQTKTNLSLMLASSTSSTTTPIIKLNSNLGNQSISSKQNHIANHIDKSMEPSISSSTSIVPEFPLKIGIIGLGEFGQFLAKAFKRQGHNVLGTSRSDYSEYCQEHGIEFYRHVNGLCEAQPDVILICSSILSTEDVVRKIPFHKLKPNTILADVLSVKEYARNLLLDVVPEGFGILCTHPMFGKFSGKNSWEGLRFVYDKVRISENRIQERKCEQFLSIFQDEGCQMVEMTCEEHDRYAAESQFITHMVARILSNMNLESTPINTKNYETLMELTHTTVSHSSDLFDGLFLYNLNAMEQIEKLDRAFETVKQNLFGKLRSTLRTQIEEKVTIDTSADRPSTYFLPNSNNVTDLSSFSLVPKQGKQDASVELKTEVQHASV